MRAPRRAPAYLLLLLAATAGGEAPAAAGDPNPPGRIEFTGTARARAEGGIPQAMGTLAAGRRIGLKVDSPTHGTLVAQGLCGRAIGPTCA